MITLTLKVYENDSVASEEKMRQEWRLIKSCPFFFQYFYLLSSRLVFSTFNSTKDLQSGILNENDLYSKEWVLITM